MMRHAHKCLQQEPDGCEVAANDRIYSAFCQSPTAVPSLSVK